MKFRVTMKTPDVLHDACVQGARAAADQVANADNEATYEQWGIAYQEALDKAKAVVAKFSSYGEYVTVEFDTDAGTARVVPR